MNGYCICVYTEHCDSTDCRAQATIYWIWAQFCCRLLGWCLSLLCISAICLLPGKHSRNCAWCVFHALFTAMWLMDAHPSHPSLNRGCHFGIILFGKCDRLLSFDCLLPQWIVPAMAQLYLVPWLTRVISSAYWQSFLTIWQSHRWMVLLWSEKRRWDSSHAFPVINMSVMMDLMASGSRRSLFELSLWNQSCWPVCCI
jgi:hypothetical protein